MTATLRPARATLLNMEFVQFHPAHMVWPLSVAGPLVTESVRGDGGVLRSSEGKRFMFGYVPDVFRRSTQRPRRRPTAGYNDRAKNRRPPELLPRDEVANCSTPDAAVSGRVPEDLGHGSGNLRTARVRWPTTLVLRDLLIAEIIVPLGLWAGLAPGPGPGCKRRR